jgi:hypothetical protein
MNLWRVLKMRKDLKGQTMRKGSKVSFFFEGIGNGKGTIIDFGEKRILIGIDEAERKESIGLSQDVDYEQVERIKW